MEPQWCDAAEPGTGAEYDAPRSKVGSMRSFEVWSSEDDFTSHATVVPVRSRNTCNRQRGCHSISAPTSMPYPNAVSCQANGG